MNRTKSQAHLQHSHIVASEVTKQRLKRAQPRGQLELRVRTRKYSTLRLLVKADASFTAYGLGAPVIRTIITRRQGAACLGFTIFKRFDAFHRLLVCQIR